MSTALQNGDSLVNILSPFQFFLIIEKYGPGSANQRVLISVKQTVLANDYCTYKLDLYQTVPPMCVILHDNAA